ncbi:hypothetical protein XHV734_2205 [Xanthomonas hortorum pv. vitians]|nr:hypothetical protein XHV734_2205 [Xanthomonas hortorum pv. vitians]
MSHPLDISHPSTILRRTPMWYFAWILGTGLAALAAVLNGMWFEARESERGQPRQ